MIKTRVIYLISLQKLYKMTAEVKIYRETMLTKKIHQVRLQILLMLIPKMMKYKKFSMNIKKKSNNQNKKKKELNNKKNNKRNNKKKMNKNKNYRKNQRKIKKTIKK